MTFATALSPPCAAKAPISFWSPIEYEGFETGNGYWALTKLDDVHFASRHPDIFSSARGITVNDQTPELAEYFGSMIVLDDPRHQRLRSIVSRAFTPKVVARIEASVRERAHRLVAAMIANHPDGQADLVSELAGPLPLQVICDMMGIPEEDHERVFHWTNVILGFGDPDLTLDFEEFLQVSMDIGAYASALAEDRRVNHHDDLTTSLVEAEVDGDRLTSPEIASFFILLVVAGNETTRNAISHGMLALSRYPEQRDKWWSDFDALAPTAVEEIVRWASPVVYMRRTLTQDFELSGTKMAAGDKAILWYNSANRDESKFANPWAFDVARNPNPHLGFRRRRCPFLFGRQPGSPRDQGCVRRIVPRNPRYRRDGRTLAPAVAIHPRHQEPAGRLDSIAADFCRADVKSHFPHGVSGVFASARRVYSSQTNKTRGWTVSHSGS